jgi:hypothetical protein
VGHGRLSLEAALADVGRRFFVTAVLAGFDQAEQNPKALAQRPAEKASLWLAVIRGSRRGGWTDSCAADGGPGLG